MKRIFLMLLALMCLPAMAEQRTASDALNVATSYLNANTPRQGLLASSGAPQLTLAMTAVNAKQQVDYYVFNNSQERGFVIVSGDDKAAPVLGYSDSGSFDENDIPDGLRYWLDCYAEQMQYLRSHPECAYQAPRSQSNVAIAPLLTTQWNQMKPFNDLCPTYTSENGTVHCPIGCVVAAFAQVMNYYRWPKQGTGSYSYECNVNQEGNQTLSADFGSTTYNWDKMLDNYIEGSYSTVEGNAVATLMYHLGVASRIKYGKESNTATFAAMEALRTYFGYNKGMRKYTRASMSATQWDGLLMNELLNSRPVIYAGFGPIASTGAHCFVLDGCDTQGYYHINWGWGGRANGYFLTTALNPRDPESGYYETGFNESQEIIINIYPDQGEPEPEKFIEAVCDSITPGVSEVKLGEIAPIIIKSLQFNSYGYGWNADISIGLMLTDLNGNQVDFDNENITTENYIFGSNYLWPKDNPFDFFTPLSLDDGDYRLWIVYKMANTSMTGYANLINYNTNLPSYIDVKVEDGVMYFSVPKTDASGLSVTTLTTPKTVGAGLPFEISATIANAGTEYCGNIYLYLYKNNEAVKDYSPIYINVATNDQVSFKTNPIAPNEAGEYDLEILDKEYNQVKGGSVKFTVVENSNYDLDIATPLKVGSYYMDMDNVNATAAICNKGTGDYVGPIFYMILSGDEKEVIKLLDTDMVTIPGGGTATVNMKTAFEGIPGTMYKMCLRDMRYPNEAAIWGDMVPFELDGIWPTTLLDKIVNNGIDGGDYRIANNLTIADAHDQSVFVTNGSGSWIELKCGDNFETVKAMNALKGGTVRGTYLNTDGNPSITLTRLPEAGVVQEGVVQQIDLSKPYTPIADQVIDFTGYYGIENGEAVVYAREGGNGQAVPISFEWLSEFSPLVEDACYAMHGVVMLKPVANGAPSVMADGNVPSNYIVYLTKAPTNDYSGVTTLNSDAVKVSVTAGTITVTGAKRVAIYNTAGALVSRNAATMLPAGVYIVVADGKSYKVIVL